jgi:hypothetical protein
MRLNDFPVLRVGVGDDVLDEVISVLVAGDVNEGDARSVDAALADAVEVPTQELSSANFQTLFDNLGSKLVHTVLRRVADNVVDGTAAVCRSSVFAYMLDTPIAKLTMGNNINVCQDLFNARALR